MGCSGPGLCFGVFLEVLFCFIIVAISLDCFGMNNLGDNGYEFFFF